MAAGIAPEWNAFESLTETMLALRLMTKVRRDEEVDCSPEGMRKEGMIWKTEVGWECCGCGRVAGEPKLGVACYETSEDGDMVYRAVRWACLEDEGCADSLPWPREEVKAVLTRKFVNSVNLYGTSVLMTEEDFKTTHSEVTSRFLIAIALGREGLLEESAVRDALAACVEETKGFLANRGECLVAHAARARWLTESWRLAEVAIAASSGRGIKPARR